MLHYVNLVSDGINQFAAAIMVYEKVNHEGQTIEGKKRERERDESGRRKRDREIETERQKE